MIESGYIGLATKATEKGDAVVVFDGVETPFILRRLRPNTKAKQCVSQTIRPDIFLRNKGNLGIHGWRGFEARV